ncbi:transposase [Sorangium sp. So ce1128]
MGEKARAVPGIAARVAKRMMRWRRRCGLVDERPAEDRSNEAPELSPIEACMQLSLFGGTFLRLAEDGTPVSLDEERFRIGARSPWAAEVSGFNVHAGVTVRAGDRERLEKLCRYGARPPFRLERLALLPDGRIATRLRRPRRNGATHLVLEPIAFMARLAAVIPPPR